MTNDNQPLPDADAQDEVDLKSIVEATFGPGAFDLIDGEEPTPETDADAAMAELSAFDGADLQSETATSEVATAIAPNPVPTENAQKLVLFEVSEHWFAIPVNNVSEIHRERRITRIPHVPKWVSGVTNLRGSITSVVDLRTRLGLPSPEGVLRRRLIVIRTAANITTGLLVDRVLGIRILSDDPNTLPDADQLMESLTRLQEAGDFVSEWRGMDLQPVAVLDLEKIIDLTNPINEPEASKS